jgi:ABC-2 type transport system ATP-binding protein
MLLGAVRPTAGWARIFGVDASLVESRRSVGYLPENHRFPTYLTGRSMLQFYGALSGCSGKEFERHVWKLLELVGLSDWEDVRIKKYSKGMLQRLGLAQALIHRPKLLVLDEPTDGVDPVGRRNIRDILNALLDSGVTIFINSHLLSEVESFCDEVAIINKGRLALQGRVRELVAGGGYKLTVDAVPEHLVDRLRALASGIISEQGMMVVHVADRNKLNEIIDEIRKAGAQIESVAPVVSTLEDVFIRTTTAAVTSQPEPVEVIR